MHVPFSNAEEKSLSCAPLYYEAICQPYFVKNKYKSATRNKANIATVIHDKLCQSILEELSQRTPGIQFDPSLA